MTYELPQKALEEFREIFLEVYGQNIPDDELADCARNIFNLFAVIDSCGQKGLDDEQDR